ncbi:MAG: HAD family hydrolase [Actinomycetota bacterium]
MNVKAVFFDAGETLVYPHPSFVELFAEVLWEQGHRVDPEDLQELVHASSERFNELMRSEKALNWSTSPERSRALWDIVYRMFLAETDIAEAEHAGLVEALYERFRSIASYRLYPDAIPTLERLQKAGVTLGLISNFEDWLEQLLETLEVSPFLEVSVISGIEGVEKPDARIFEIALERAGADAAASVYVGDNPIFDAEAARQAGMIPVLIDRRDRHSDVDVIRISSLEELPGAIGLPV